MDLAAKGLGAKEWNNSLKTKLSLLPKKLFRIRMSRNFGMKMRLILIRSEERFSRNAETDLVCRLLLEKKKVLIEGTGSVRGVVVARGERAHGGKSAYAHWS